MIIGVPREIAKDEDRVGLVPANVSSLIRLGNHVLVEKDAGLGIGMTDLEYRKAGAEIVDSAKVIYSKSDMIIKVMEPLKDEYKFLKKGLILFSFLHLAINEELTKILLEKGVTAIGYETIEERGGYLPVLAPMSEVAGRMAIQLGAHYLQSNKGGRGTLLGGVPGVKKGTVTVIGAGVVGQNAIQTAVGIGANVIALDTNMQKLRVLENRYKGLVQTMYSNSENIKEAICNSHVIVGAVLVPGGKSPILIKKKYLSRMKRGSVIIDVSIDQGGITETIKVTNFKKPIYKVDGVIHYAIPNMPGAVARTSTFALTNMIIPYIKEVSSLGIEKASTRYYELKKGINTHKHELTHKIVADVLKYKYYEFE